MLGESFIVLDERSVNMLPASARGHQYIKGRGMEGGSQLSYWESIDDTILLRTYCRRVVYLEDLSMWTVCVCVCVCVSIDVLPRGPQRVDCLCVCMCVCVY